MPYWKRRVLDNFSKHAHTYDGACELQKDVAKNLSDLLPQTATRILEIGCGTGILTKHLVEKYKDAQITASDISPEMLTITRAKFPSVKTLVMDADNPKIDGGFDLIVSSMTLHWLENPNQAVKKLLNLLTKDGVLMFAVPAPNALEQWNKVLESLKIPSGIIEFPSINGVNTIKTSRIVYKNTLDFLKSIKNTGSATPNKKYKTQRFVILKKVCKMFDKTAQNGVDWKISYARFN